MQELKEGQCRLARQQFRAHCRIRCRLARDAGEAQALKRKQARDRNVSGVLGVIQGVSVRLLVSRTKEQGDYSLGSNGGSK